MHLFCWVFWLLWTQISKSYCHNACPSISGTFTIGLSDVYPESADFDPQTCNIYISATGNNTLVEYNPISQTASAIVLNGISGNESYLLSGVDYSTATGTLFISANARAAFFTEGRNLTGPNRLLQYDPLSQSVIRDIDFAPIIAQIESQLSTEIGGFQDQAEDQFGNAYYMATWGNVIIKVSPSNDLSLFYAPPSAQLNASTAGFGGLAILQDLLIVTDAISASFVVFNLSNTNISPNFVHPSDVPAGYSPLECDSLIFPDRYTGTVALCADDFVQGIGGVAVYQSSDNWTTAKYLGILLNDRQQVPNGTTTATFEATGSIYAVITYIPDASGIQPVSNVFPIIDITERIDAILKGQEHDRY